MCLDDRSICPSYSLQLPFPLSLSPSRTLTMPIVGMCLDSTIMGCPLLGPIATAHLCVRGQSAKSILVNSRSRQSIRCLHPTGLSIASKLRLGHCRSDLDSKPIGMYPPRHEALGTGRNCLMHWSITANAERDGRVVAGTQAHLSSSYHGFRPPGRVGRLAARSGLFE